MASLQPDVEELEAKVHLQVQLQVLLRSKSFSMVSRSKGSTEMDLRIGASFIRFQTILLRDSFVLDFAGDDRNFILSYSQDEDIKQPARVSHGGYGAYNAYITAATRYAALGAPTLYDHPSSAFGRGVSEPVRGMGKKIFVGRLPQEANAEDLRQYFGRFGRIIDVYVPKDPKRTGHRGFGFVTFAEDGVAERVSRRTHEIHGQQVAIDTATPLDDGGTSGPYMDPMEQMGGGYGGPMRGGGYGRLYGSLDFDDWGYGGGGGRSSRMDLRYRPY